MDVTSNPWSYGFLMLPTYLFQETVVLVVSFADSGGTDDAVYDGGDEGS